MGELRKNPKGGLNELFEWLSKWIYGSNLSDYVKKNIKNVWVWTWCQIKVFSYHEVCMEWIKD